MSQHRKFYQGFYDLKFSSVQLPLLIQAVEFLLRAQMGQFDHLVTDLGFHYPRSGQEDVDWEQAHVLAGKLKMALFPGEPEAGGPSIRSESVPDRVRVLYDLLQVLKAQQSEDRGEAFLGGNIWDSVRQAAKTCPLASIRHHVTVNWPGSEEPISPEEMQEIHRQFYDGTSGPNYGPELHRNNAAFRLMGAYIKLRKKQGTWPEDFDIRGSEED